jgi:mannose-6-phosphate isomerase-like protein (cupin superfamily)
MEMIRTAGDPAEPARTHYVEHLRVPDLSVGTCRIPAGGVDGQSPHTEDEIYVVTAGRARLVADSGTADVGPGDVVYVPAGEAHRFVDITEDLALLVVFAPAQRSRANGQGDG